MNFDTVIRGGTVVTAELSQDVDVGITNGQVVAPVSYTHLTLPTNREV